MKSAVYAIIRKDIRSVTSNRQLFLPILLVPLIMIVVLPTIFVVTVRFVPEETGDLDALLTMLPVSCPGRRRRTGSDPDHPEQYPARLLSHYPDHDLLCHGGGFIRWGKGKTYTGNTALLPPAAWPDLLRQDHGIFSHEHDGLPSVLSGNARIYGDGAVRTVRRPHGSVV